MALCSPILPIIPCESNCRSSLVRISRIHYHGPAMKVPLETTTVREMLSKGGECLLCDLEAKAQLIRYFLGNSVMQPQIRVKVNRSGFCAPHFQALYKAGNRLGLALITHTHLPEAGGNSKGLRLRHRLSVGKGSRVPPEPAHLRRVLSSSSGRCSRACRGKSVEVHPAELVFGYTRLAEAQP